MLGGLSSVCDENHLNVVADPLLYRPIYIRVTCERSVCELRGVCTAAMSDEHQHSGAECQQQQQRRPYVELYQYQPRYECIIRWHDNNNDDDDDDRLLSLSSDSWRTADNDCRQQRHNDHMDVRRRRTVADGRTLHCSRSTLCRCSYPRHHQRLPPLQVIDVKRRFYVCFFFISRPPLW